MNEEPEAPDGHRDAIMTWHGQGMSFAEIGHRLGVSPDRLRQIMAAGGINTSEMDDPNQDDDGPNRGEMR